MIDERELTDLLTAAAENCAVPRNGPRRILAAATAATTEKPAAPAWWRTHRLAVACAVLILVVGSTVAIRAVTRGGGSNVAARTAGTASGEQMPGSSVMGPAQNGFAAPGPAGSSGAGGTAAAEGTAAGRDSASGAEGVAPPAGGAAAPSVPTQSNVQPLPDTAKVVKTGSVQLEVERQAVGPTMGQLAGLATGLGGYVADTKSSEGGDDPSGSVTLRVPAGSFEELLTRVRALGDVRASTTHGQDVTGQYSDIQARLTALNATRNQLLTIMQKATAIGDVLAVQDRINDVQTQIDQLQGQQKVLDDQASMASLAVDVAQHGAAQGPPAKPGGLAKAWNDARHGFSSGVEDILAASGTALVVLLVLALLVVGGRAAWMAARRRAL